MKRFVVFGGDRYNKGGGFSDLLVNEDTKEQAQKKIEDLAENYQSQITIDWWHIVDITTGAVVEFYGEDPCYSDDVVSMKYVNGELVLCGLRPEPNKDSLPPSYHYKFSVMGKINRHFSISSRYRDEAFDAANEHFENLPKGIWKVISKEEPYSFVWDSFGTAYD